MEKKYLLLLALFGASLLASSLLSFIPVSSICDPGKGCDVVQHSKYAYFYGIKNSHFGVIIFGILFYTTYLNILNPSKDKKFIIYLGTIGSSFVAIYFLYVQQFILKAYCKYCMVVDISTLIALGTIASMHFKINLK